MPDFIKIRSFLFANVENLLENLSIRRHNGKIEAEDLFSDTHDTQEMNWLTNFEDQSKIKVLLQEKESLGLYVSGHPLDDYKQLLYWCRETSGRDDVYLILVDKIRKIFTKSNTMMFVLQVSVPDLEAEGIIFPKNAMHLSSLLEEKEMYWVKGKVQQNKKSEKSPAKKELITDNDEAEDVKDETEIKEFDELPKLIIDSMVIFEQGILPLFEHEDIPLATNRIKKLKAVSWKNLKTHPTLNPEEHIKQDDATGNLSVENSISTIFLPKSLGAAKLKEITRFLKNSSFKDSVEVKVEVESSEGVKKVKNTMWTTKEILSKFKKVD
jgi:DNA polymerase III alpha subunit